MILKIYQTNKVCVLGRYVCFDIIAATIRGFMPLFWSYSCSFSANLDNIPSNSSSDVKLNTILPLPLAL